MAQNQYNINDLRESFNYLLKINYEVQNNVKEALRLEDYLKAVKTIIVFVNSVDNLVIKALNIAKKCKEKANYEEHHICLKIVNMAEYIIKTHLEVKDNIRINYFKKNNK